MAGIVEEQMRTTLALLAVLIAVPLFGQGVPPSERILVPIFAQPGPGAFGSFWQSELWVHNDTDEPVQTGLGPVFPPKTTIGPLVGDRAVGTPGLVMFTRREHEAHLHFSVRIRDLSRQAQTWGTEIPVVRESEFFTGRMQLLAVPTDGRFRTMLRVYEFLGFGLSPGAVRVRFYRTGVSPDVLLHEQTVSLAGTGVLAYAQLASLPPEVSDAAPVRIEIEPLKEMWFWAFVSITNNETQHVTIITPQ